MHVTGITVGPLEENCWLLHDEATGDVVLVDPGAEPERICAAVEASGGTLRDIWLTHAHFDHIGGVQGVRRGFPGVPVHLHAADQPVYAFGSRAAASWGIPFEQPEPAEAVLVEGQVVHCGGTAFDVWHLPGHAPGHVAFISADAMFGGDVLFAGSIGRTDLPLSDPAAMDASLRRVATLPPAIQVYPGHGPPTSIAAELRMNPFLNGAARVLGS